MSAPKLRGHAYYVELAGRRGGPSPLWLIALAVAAGIAYACAALGC